METTPHMRNFWLSAIQEFIKPLNWLKDASFLKWSDSSFQVSKAYYRKEFNPYRVVLTASARPIMCFIALILFSLVLNFMYGNLNLTVLLKFIVYMFYLLLNCLFLFDSKYILLHYIVLLHCKCVSLVNLFCP
jgi:hypothetical protein